MTAGPRSSEPYECPCHCWIRCGALWSLYQVTVPTPLRLPPTSQRPDPSIMVMSAASGSLPAAHAFLHNNNKKSASILLPPLLSSCPSPACHKGLCSSFPVCSAQTQGCPRAKTGVAGVGGWGLNRSWTLTYSSLGILRKRRLREEKTFKEM